jgi:hypothetical protein
MICKTCNEERPTDDFLLKNEECYRCVYKKKMEGMTKEVKKPPNKCKTCGMRVPPPKTSFCCEECAQIGWQKQRKEYWPRKIVSPGTNFNKWPHWAG